MRQNSELSAVIVPTTKKCFKNFTSLGFYARIRNNFQFSREKNTKIVAIVNKNVHENFAIQSKSVDWQKSFDSRTNFLSVCLVKEMTELWYILRYNELVDFRFLSVLRCSKTADFI